MTVLLYSLRRLLRRPSNVILIALIPLLTLMLPDVDEAHWMGLPLAFQLHGLGLWFIAARLSVLLLEDRASRVLIRVAVAPISYTAYLWQVLLALLIILTGVNLVVIGGASLRHGVGLAQSGILFALYTLFTVAAVAFLLAWYSLVRDRETASIVVIVLIILMIMLGGMMWPIQAMPVSLQRLARGLPTYWMAEGLVRIGEGASGVALLLPMGMLLVFGALFLILGSRRPVS